MKKQITIKCWVAMSSDNIFQVARTRKLAIQEKWDMKGFDLDNVKIYKAKLIIAKYK